MNKKFFFYINLKNDIEQIEAILTVSFGENMICVEVCLSLRNSSSSHRPHFGMASDEIVTCGHKCRGHKRMPLSRDRGPNILLNKRSRSVVNTPRFRQGDSNFIWFSSVDLRFEWVILENISYFKYVFVSDVLMTRVHAYLLGNEYWLFVEFT